jgi:ankyrin repeat protein
MTLDREGRSPLHHAALEGDVDQIARLLEAGERATLADTSGYTPLHFAAQQGHSDAIAALITAGADVNAQDRWGNSPLWRAIFNTTNREACVAGLLAAGADPDLVNTSAVTPRMLADRLGIAGILQSHQPPLETAGDP